MNRQVTIVSCGVCPGDLTDRHREAIAQADVLAGGQRLLDWFPEFKGEKIPMGAHSVETIEQIAARSRAARVVVLASGDALFFGVGRLFASRMEPGQLTVLPNITAAQAALARLCLAWENVLFFSVHGRARPLPWRAILQAGPAVIYCDSIRTPSIVATELINRWPAASARPAVILADLGTATEICIRRRLADLTAAQTPELAMLVLTEDYSTLAPPLSLGLPDSLYVHEADLITHSEIRAVVISKLRIGPGVMWDIGAGSGSVGIEAVGLCERLDVYAVEKNPERCTQILRNAASAGCNIHIVQGEAPSAFRGLPSPRSVFVGGGGESVRSIIEAAFQRLLPGGMLVATAILLETKARLFNCLPTYRTELLEIEVRHAQPLGSGHRMDPDNPISLFIFKKEPL